MLFTIWHITYFSFIILDYKNLKFKHLIDNVVINFRSFIIFASIKDIRRRCNLIVDLSKFISNKKILSEVIALGYNQVCYQILS